MSLPQQIGDALSRSILAIAIPVPLSLGLATAVWLASGSFELGGLFLIGCSTGTVAFESALLWLQELDRNKPRLGTAEFYGWLRRRSLSWAVLATAIAGIVLVVARVVPSINRFLVPVSDYPVSELVVLGLTIAILTLLTRHSTESATNESRNVTNAFSTLVSGLDAQVMHLRESIDRLAGEVARLSSPRAARPRLNAAVVYRHGPKGTGSLAWAVSAAEASITNMEVEILVDGVTRSQLSIGNLAIGDRREGDIIEAKNIGKAGEIVVKASFQSEAGEQMRDLFTYAYHRISGFLGGIKDVEVERI